MAITGLVSTIKMELPITSMTRLRWRASKPTSGSSKSVSSGKSPRNDVTRTLAGAKLPKSSGNDAERRVAKLGTPDERGHLGSIERSGSDQHLVEPRPSRELGKGLRDRR